MLSKREFPNLSREVRRGIPASLRKGERNPPSASDRATQGFRKEWRDVLYG